jgi:CheY-like chemotaxis protein
MQLPGDILVVDDDAAIVDLVVELLQDEGYQVRSARNGALALDVIAEQRPAMILVDMRMPQMNGETFLATLQERGISNIPVVLMTADAIGARKFVSGYAVDYLAKPFDIDQLIECITRYVGRPGSSASSNNSTRSHLA